MAEDKKNKPLMEITNGLEKLELYGVFLLGGLMTAFALNLGYMLFGKEGKVESLYDPKTFPKADSIVVDTTAKPDFHKDGFSDGLKRYSIHYLDNGESVDSISRTRWFYDDKRRKIRMEYDAGLDNRLDQVESTNYNKNGEWRRKTDYGGNGEDDLIVISPGYKEYNQ